MPERSRLLPRMISSLRTPSVVLQPSTQCVQMVPTCCISHGRVLIAVRAAGERADRADVDAHAALVAFEMVAFVGDDLGNDAAVGDAERAHAHAFIADAHAAVAENAARRIVEHHGRPLLLVDVDLLFGEAALAERRSGTSCPAARTRRPCRTPGNRAGGW